MLRTFIFVVLILLSIPGLFVTLFASGVAVNLIWAELYPDPNDIGHGMAMLGLVPMIVWAIFGLLYLLLLRVLWSLTKKKFPVINQQ